MIVTKTQGKFLHGVIDQWVAEQTIPPETAEHLRQSFSIRPFDWKKLAKYCFWISLISLIIAIGSVLADRVLFALLKKFLDMSDAMRSLALAAWAALVFYLGLARRRKKPNRVFSTEAIFFIGVLFCAGSIVSLGQAIDTGSGHFSLLFLLATVVYGLLAVALSSKLIWVFSILSLGSWFGAETGYASGWGAYYLGMNFPLRFVLFGAVLTAASFGFSHIRQLQALRQPTYVLGLLYLFIALWILSIFGNYGDSEWFDTRQIELLHWGLLFALVAIAAIVYGLKYDDYTSRAFGITFLFINLYTKYFEFFWDATHKAVFFLILAVSFWLIGSHAEKIWNLEFRKRDSAAD
ncbi:MAG: DUF2157 domain-containing protein [Betaproteobacteria bacterium]|nr:DUF2157 domain-containing protein [Betaproteobacteria bacterium]MCL2885323.1 DUF2157 domain-containing protein [Betaproteobacteria bacterium]